MFKSNWLSVFFSKPVTIKSDDIPKHFTIDNENDVVNVSMDQEDDFVNINTNPLTYAEVAELNKHKPLSSKVDQERMVPLTTKVKENDIDHPLEDSIHEKFKSDAHYKKHKQYKVNEKKKNKKRGKKRA